MPIEALLWSLAILLTPLIASHLPPAWQGASAARLPAAEGWWPWLHSLGLPYAGLLAGSVSDRHAGLVGLPADRWFIGGLACLLALAAAWFAGRRRPVPSPAQPQLIREEARWGFYRGAASLWLPLPLAPLAGFVTAVLEAGLTLAGPSAARPKTDDLIQQILRAACSSVLFAVLGNLWLVAATMVGVHALLRQGEPV